MTAELFDRYDGRGVPEGRVSLGFRLVFQRGDRALKDAEVAVTEGRRMSESLGEHEVVSPIVMRMIVVGEETGKLDSCLEKVSKRMDDEIRSRPG